MCKRVDSAPVDQLIEKEEETANALNEEESKSLQEAFTKQISDETYEVKTEALSPKTSFITVTEDEFMRRMQEMSKMQGNAMFGAMPQKFNFIVNTNHPKAKEFLDAKPKAQEEKMKKAFSLALLAKGLLKGEALFEFLKAEEEKL